MQDKDAVKMEAIMTEIEVEIKATDLNTPGCFGSLLRCYPDKICEECVHNAPCLKKMEKDKFKLIESADEMTARLVLEYELDAEIEELSLQKSESKSKSKSKSEPENGKVAESDHKSENGKVAESNPKPENGKVAESNPKPEGPKSMKIVMADIAVMEAMKYYDKMAKGKKVPFDWPGVASLIVATKPKTFPEVRQICIDHVPDKDWHRCTAYRFCNALMKRLEKDGYIRWDAETQSIEYDQV